MADVYLVCEGPADGLDVRVLDAILAQKLGAFVRIAPAGGDKNLAGVRQYIEARGLGAAIAIEDRNHRSRADAALSWIGTKQRLVWHRHEIENYLLEPRVVAAAFDSLRSRMPRLPSSERVVDVLADVARPMLFAHAAKLLAHALYVTTTHGNPVDFRLPGRARPEWRRAEWLDALHHEATRVSVSSGAVERLPDLAPSAIEARYDALLEEVQRDAFIERGDHLRDIEGKELLAALASHVGLSRPALEDELVRVLPRVYEPATLFDPDEFVMLRDRIAALS